MPLKLPAATTLGRRIRAARLAKKWTLAELGQQLFGEDDPNTAAPRMSRYERGLSTPNVKVLEKLAELLDLPQAYFLARPAILADALLVLTKLSPAGKKQALKLIKKIAAAERKSEKK